MEVIKPRPAKVSEKTLERRLKRDVEKRDGELRKLQYTINGDPDRLILIPGAWSCFVELKSWGKKPSKLQRSRLRRLSSLGFNTKAIADEKGYTALIREIDIHLINHKLIG